jgi:acyl carrier protein
MTPTDDLDVTEAMLAALWRDVLGVDQVSSGDNFLDLGGDSARATQLTWRIADLFAVELALTWMFKYPTLRELAVAVQARRSQPGVPR